MEVKAIILNCEDIPKSIQGLDELFTIIGDAVGFSMAPSTAKVFTSSVKMSEDMFDKILNALISGTLETQHSISSITKKLLIEDLRHSLKKKGPCVEKSLPRNTISVDLSAFSYEGEPTREDKPCSYRQQNGLYLPYNEIGMASVRYEIDCHKDDILNSLASSLSGNGDLDDDEIKLLLENTLDLNVLKEMVLKYESALSKTDTWSSIAEYATSEYLESIAKKTAYELYKRDWILDHSYNTETTYESLENEFIKTRETEECFDDWVAKKLGNQIYACYEEFLNTEFKLNRYNLLS